MRAFFWSIYAIYDVIRFILILMNYITKGVFNIARSKNLKDLVALYSQSRNSTCMDNFKKIMANNKEWARESVLKDPEFFSSLVDIQSEWR